MKWTNKGHEFDEIGTKISSIKKVMFFGAGLAGEMAYNILKNQLEILGFIDNDPQKKDFLGLPVYSLESFKSIDSGDITVIITPFSEGRKDSSVVRQMEKNGYVYKDNLFIIKDFLPIYMWYKNKKMVTHRCLISITDKCSLNCKHCNSFIPFLKKHEHISFHKIKNDIDLFFNVFDYVGMFGISGGEALLSPYFNQIIEYIYTNYEKKIGNVLIFTNGIVKPSDETLEVLKKYKQNIELMISDYSSFLSQYKETVVNTSNYLKNNGIKIRLNIPDKWYDPGYETVNRENASIEELMLIFNKCAIDCNIFKNGKYYKCEYDGRALNAGFIKEDSGFSLVNLDEKDKPVLMEYNLGYNDKGYVELCKRCNGFWPTNNHYVPVAEQVIR